MDARRRRALGAVALALAGLASTAGAADATSRPTIYGGTGASGNPGVVRLAISDDGHWYACSAAMWKPRLLLTAAHCVTKEGGSGGVDNVIVFPPGVEAPIYADVGPVGASSVAVKQWWRASDYAQSGSTVAPNDFAVIELASDLAPPAYTRLSTQLDIARWADDASVVEHVGYGLTGPERWTDVPMTISLPISAYVPESAVGPVFRTQATAERGICPGDSGSPVFRHQPDGSYVLLGTVAGGIGPCVEGSSGTPQALNFIAMAYLDLLNPALASAGYPTIPSAPRGLSLTARNRDVQVSWDVPASSPESVVAYQVISADGTIACTSATSPCTVTGLPDGRYAYTVRAVNADGDGDVLPVDASDAVPIAAPSQMSPPSAKAVSRSRARIAFRTLAGTSSAVVSAYVVTDARGRHVCSIAPGPDLPARLSCTTRALPSGPSRFRVTALTEMGRTPASGLSSPITIR